MVSTDRKRVTSELEGIADKIKKNGYKLDENLVPYASYAGGSDSAKSGKDFDRTLKNYKAYYMNQYMVYDHYNARKEDKSSDKDSKAWGYVKRLINDVNILIKDGDAYIDLANKFNTASKKASDESKKEELEKWTNEFNKNAINEYFGANGQIEELLDNSNLPYLNDPTLVNAHKELDNKIKKVRDKLIAYKDKQQIRK